MLRKKNKTYHSRQGSLAGLSGKDRIGLKIILACVIVLAVLLGLFFFVKGNVVPYNEASLCPETIQRHTILLIDKSDAPTRSQSWQIGAIIEALKNDLQPLEKFTITSLSERQGDIDTLFSKCNPGTGKQANALYQNPVMIQKKFDEKFGLQLREVEESIKHHGEAKNSYILEALQVIANMIDFDSNVMQKRLIIISDMMQHSGWLSHYHALPDYNEFIQTTAGKGLQADMTDVMVKIYYIVRRPVEPSWQNRHILFWKDYFQQQQVSSVTVRKIN